VSASEPPAIDWHRIYPHAQHRWVMGLRPGSLGAFFARRETTAAACAERARWLAEDPEAYSALPAEALPALADTVALARELGINIDPAAGPCDQLLALGRAWEADFVWMHPAPDGQHRLIGGVVCFPSLWALRDKLGRTMAEVHAPVPDLNDALARPIEAFFARLRPDEVWVRENVNFASDRALNHHPAWPHWPIDPATGPDGFWFRFEHQLLLKLPASGSVLFCIRVELIPLATVLTDAAGAARLADVFATMSEDAATYKGIAHARDALVAMCQGHWRLGGGEKLSGRTRGSAQ
jgi:hypothetical protein